MKRIIWTSSLDLSADGVKAFCKQAAGRYGKTEEELRALPLLELASSFMWNERRRRFYEAGKILSPSSDGPILVIADKADFGNRSHVECTVLTGRHLSEILEYKEGLSTTFFSDGKDIRCEDITENGTNFYLFRVVSDLKGLGAFVAAVERGEPFTENELAKCTRSLAPAIHELMDWPMEQEKTSKVSHVERPPVKKKTVSLER